MGDFNIELPQTSFNPDNAFEIQLWKAAASSGNGVPNPYTPYTTAEVVGRVFGDLIMIVYTLDEPGNYKFRARLKNLAGNGQNGTSGWTNWRKIKVTTLKSVVTVKDNSFSKIEKKQIVLSQKTDSQFSSTKSGIKVTPKITETVSGRSFKMVPIISRPVEKQKYMAGAPISLVVQGVEKEESVKWELEYKPFTKNKYKKIAVRNIRITNGSSGSYLTGKIIAKKSGEYRLRIRKKEKGSRWGQWRQFQIGTSLKSKTLILNEKTKPVTKIKSQTEEPQEKNTKPTEHQVKPVTQEKITKPKVKPTVHQVKPSSTEPESKPTIQLQN